MREAMPEREMKPTMLATVSDWPVITIAATEPIAAIGRAGGGKANKGGRGVIHHQSTNREPLGSGIKSRHLAGHFNFSFGGVCLLDTGGRGRTRSCSGEAMHLDAVTHSNTIKTARNAGVENGAGRDRDNSTGDGESVVRGVDGRYWPLNQAALLDGLRTVNAVCALLGAKRDDFTGLEIGLCGGLAFLRNRSGVRLVAHPVDDDAAEATDGAGHESDCGSGDWGRWADRRRRRGGRTTTTTTGRQA